MGIYERRCSISTRGLPLFVFNPCRPALSEALTCIPRGSQPKHHQTISPSNFTGWRLSGTRRGKTTGSASSPVASLCFRRSNMASTLASLAACRPCVVSWRCVTDFLVLPEVERRMDVDTASPYRSTATKHLAHRSDGTLTRSDNSSSPPS